MSAETFTTTEEAVEALDYSELFLHQQDSHFVSNKSSIPHSRAAFLPRLPPILRDFLTQTHECLNLDPITALLPMLALASAPIGNGRALRLYNDVFFSP